MTSDAGCSSIEGVEEALERLVKKRDELENLWAARKLRLDLLLRLRLFQRDSVDVRMHSLVLLLPQQSL